MAKNADPAADDGTQVTEEDLRDAKYGKDEVDPTEEDESSTESTNEESEETSEDDGKTDTPATEETEESDETETDEESSEFVKEFPNIKGETLEDYARELERTLHLSNKEGKRLSDELKKSQTTDESDRESDEGPVDPRLLYVDRLVSEDVEKTFNEFKRSYPQVDDPVEYERFVAEADSLQKYHLSKNEVLLGKELYAKVATILGWQPAESSKDRLNVALKDRAATAKTNSATKPKIKSKVTDQMVAVNKMMYPDKSEAEIRKELEPYVK